MAEPFKNLVSADSIAAIARMLARSGPFDTAGFAADATRGLEHLELKARVAHVARALRPRLAPSFPAALERLLASLPEPEPGLLAQSWLWPVLHVVEDEGADHPDESLAALQRLTRHFSGEFAIRPILARHPERAYRALGHWVEHPDEHVRRLVSEGTRPRLPWGMQLRAAVADPGPGLRLIERLVDDPSDYVRRSVANHLGDVAKDHPARAVAVAAGWLAARSDRLPLVRHALRGPLKRGDPDALALVGLSTAPVRVHDLRVAPDPARVGDSLVVSAAIEGAGRVRTDVVWEWPAVRGGWSRRTFVGKERTLAPGERWPFTTALSLRPVTTRPLRPGPQRVYVRVAGALFGPVPFDLEG
jgi:3-methyladenine DNA glycosylase AlkC